MSVLVSVGQGAAEFDFVIKVGATYTDTLIFSDQSGQPFEFDVGWSAKLQVRINTGDADPPLMEFNTGAITSGAIAQGTIFLGSEGQIILQMNQTNITKITFTTAQYDLVLVAPTGEKLVFIEGNYIASYPITR